MYDLAVGDDLGDDLDGDDLMLGDDLDGDDLVLGGRRRAARSGGRQKVKLARIQPTNQTQILSFPQGAAGASTVAASATVTLSARPQRVFQTERFVIPSTVSPYFAIVDLVIGRDSMFVNSEAAAAEVFSQTGVGVSLRGFIARPGIDVTLTVTNLDTVNARAFYGSIIGPALV